MDMWAHIRNPDKCQNKKLLSESYRSHIHNNDADNEVVDPVVLPRHSIHFVTALEPDGFGFFQAFLATSPRHPVLKLCLEGDGPFC